MKNPLRKRYLRELRQDFGKYLVIFLFLTAVIAFVSGFLVADGSMKRAYDESFSKYKVEDGHFELAAEAGEELLTELAGKDVSVYPLFYTEQMIREDHTIRIFAERTQVNLPCVMEGYLPKTADEIAIDRLYAENNEIALGDILETEDKAYTVCGFIALSDYSTLFRNNTDIMFDAQKFCVGLVTQEAFAAFEKERLHYTYAWRNREALSDSESREKADSLLEFLKEKAMLTDFVKQADNQAIQFTGEDMGGDKTMMIWLLYIVMVILAFIFAVTTANTIEQEAMVIGTLRASGYTKGELLRHYMFLPIIVTFVSALIGNVLGYTLLKEVVVEMYYHSYSLPTYVTIWNEEAFLLTTVVPGLIIFIVNLLVLYRKLALSPLQFLRRDLGRKKKTRVLRLPIRQFFMRFRIRVILQNIPVYLTLVTGILLASVLLLFGQMFLPLLDHFKEEVDSSAVAEYQYVLKAMVETKDGDAEKYAVLSLMTEVSEEEISVYGIAEDSRYFQNMTLPTEQGSVLISGGYMEKYGLKAGDTILLKQKYEDEEYRFTVADSCYYPSTLAIFMSIEDFRAIFDKEEDYFSGYLSDKELTDIDSRFVASTITPYDLTIVTTQLKDSTGKMMYLMCGFAVLMYVLIMYLLSKIVIEKNAASISMVKILGYSNREVCRLYITATALVVASALLLGLPFSHLVIKAIYQVMMQSLNGWLPFYVEPGLYGKMLLFGCGSFLLVSLLHFNRVRKISMEEALKNGE